MVGKGKVVFMRKLKFEWMRLRLRLRYNQWCEVRVMKKEVIGAFCVWVLDFVLRVSDLLVFFSLYFRGMGGNLWSCSYIYLIHFIDLIYSLFIYTVMV